MKTDARNIIMVVGGCIALLGAVLYITGWSWVPYLYLFGAVLFAAAQITDRYTGTDKTVKRLRAQQVTGAVFLVLAGVMMFADPWHVSVFQNQQMNPTLRTVLLSLTRPNSWILFLVIAALFELYPAFRLPSAAANSSSEE